MRQAAGPALLALLAGLLAPPARAASPWQVELAGQQEWQQWRETGSGGGRLVDEDGRLTGLAGALRWTSDGGASVVLRAGGLWGARDYRGLSSRGVEVHSRSDIGHAFTRLEGALAPQPLAEGWQWRPLLAVEFWQWRRTLRDASNASGYPERYRQGLLWAGLQADGGAGWRARLEAGGGADGHNRVQLPGRDPARLPLGAAQGWRAAFGAAWAPGWRWELAAEDLRLNAGAERPITLQGVPLQSARQPRTGLRRLQLQLGWEG